MHAKRNCGIAFLQRSRFNFSIKEVDDFSETTDATNETKQENKEDEKEEKGDTNILVYFRLPILPFSTLTIENVNRNDFLVQVALKYGTINLLNETETQVENVIFFNQEEDAKQKLNSGQNFVYATKSHIKYSGETLEIKGSDAFYKVKALKVNKFKNVSSKNLEEISFDVEFDLESRKENRAELHKNIRRLSALNDQVSQLISINSDVHFDGKIKFDLSKENVLKTLETIDELAEKDLKAYRTFIKQCYFLFTLRLMNCLEVLHSKDVDFRQNFGEVELGARFALLKLNFEELATMLDYKLNKYKFQEVAYVNTESPFSIETEVEKRRAFKYREIIRSRIANLDKIEKLKEEFNTKVNEIKEIEKETKEFLFKEIDKISGVSYESENNKRIEYIKHVLSLPWDKVDEPEWDVEYARKVLDKQMFGLEKTKERIYEFIAKNKRNNNKKGCVILLTGGPGTGKTKVAKVIAQALKRKEGFVSLAGIFDGRTVLGFKRTYVSSTPGLFIKEMQKVGVKNPVMIVDEIDKISFRSHSSNIYYALLQLLNNEESHRFTDHYMEIPFDFSNTIFILTSNSTDIFPPLMDRMEVIKIDPYMDSEKFLIAKNYSVNEVLKSYNLQDQVIFTDKALIKLIESHCKREAGVRKLKKLIEQVVRKVNAKLEFNDQLRDKPIEINSENVFKILSEPQESDKVLEDFNSLEAGVGQCLGLFVSKTGQSNSWGDAALFSLKRQKDKFIDAAQNDSKFKITYSGNIGEDSKQSLEIAFCLAAEKLNQLEKSNYEKEYFKRNYHYSCPELLLPKSGPSAGVVNYLICLSEALQQAPIPNLAMTGEVSLDGSVLKIGGVKEKAQGAQRYGVRTLVIPIGNKSDFLELHDNLKNCFKKVYFAKNVDEIFKIGFGKDTSDIDQFVPNDFLGDSEINEVRRELNLIDSYI